MHTLESNQKNKFAWARFFYPKTASCRSCLSVFFVRNWLLMIRNLVYQSSLSELRSCWSGSQVNCSPTDEVFVSIRGNSFMNGREGCIHTMRFLWNSEKTSPALSWRKSQALIIWKSPCMLFPIMSQSGAHKDGQLEQERVTPIDAHSQGEISHQY